MNHLELGSEGQKPTLLEYWAKLREDEGHPEIAFHLRQAAKLAIAAHLEEFSLPPFYNFDGKIALVTGAANGIGRETTERFVQGGAFVVALDNNGPRLTAEIGRIRDENKGAKISGIIADVGRMKDWQPQLARLGRIDVLCNVAGIIDPPLNPEDPESQPNINDLMQLMKTHRGRRKVEADLLKVYKTNYKGPYLLSLAVASKMTEGIVPASADDSIAKKRRSGVIINVGSSNVYTLNPNRIAYGPLKAALHNDTLLLAKTLSVYGIRVNCVAPGATAETEVVRDIEAAARRMPLGISYPRHVTDAILFLASDQADQITGLILPVEGGRILPH